MKKILAMLLATVMVVGCFTGCGSDKKNDSSEVVSTEQSGSKEETPELDMSETVKMGILVSDATSAEALAFRTYYTEYIQKQYNVELIYSDELKDAAGETSAIDTFITNNCKAIISFSSFDRAAQIEQCEAAGVYYAVATGTLTDGTAMDGGMLDYLAGKFSASIGPIFIATYRAVLGSPIRTEDGNALALSQGYWVATSPEEFSEYYAVDSSVDSPAYTKGMLDGLLTADYASFEKFVSAYGFKDIQEEAK